MDSLDKAIKYSGGFVCAKKKVKDNGYPDAGRFIENEMLDDYNLAVELRNQITGENNAINGYMRLAERINDDEIKRAILDIANEEKVHVGELTVLLYKVDPEAEAKHEEGTKEVKKEEK